MIVDYATCTISANSPEYIFTIALSDRGMDRLKHKSLLGGFVRIQKNKYEFLNDLAEALAVEIVEHLERLEK